MCDFIDIPAAYCFKMIIYGTFLVSIHISLLSKTFRLEKIVWLLNCIERARLMRLLLCGCAEPRKVLPRLKTDEPVCPEGKLSCGNGECIDKELFCNDKPDCKDGSDENACCKLSIEKFTAAH